MGRGGGPGTPGGAGLGGGGLGGGTRPGALLGKGSLLWSKDRLRCKRNVIYGQALMRLHCSMCCLVSHVCIMHHDVVDRQCDTSAYHNIEQTCTAMHR